MFIARIIPPYLISIFGYSVILSIIIAQGIEAAYVYFLVVIYAFIITAILGLPVSYLVWKIQQIKRIELNHLSATLLGLGFGTLICFLFFSVIRLELAEEALLFSALVGGGYGASLTFFFSLFGGFDTSRSAQN